MMMIFKDEDRENSKIDLIDSLSLKDAFKNRLQINVL